jgi:hypothetical protein
MSSQEGWQVLRQWLESKIKNSWVDPIKANDDAKLLYEYKLAWSFAKAAQEIIDFVDMNIQQAEQLTRKEKGELVDKLREGLS